MLHFAYDGSLNGDWLGHYGIRLAAHRPDRRLHVLHARDGSDADLEPHLARMRSECARFGVELSLELLPWAAGRISDRLLAAVPRGADELLLCGARARPRNRVFLSGTVSERLLGAAKVRTLCIRVVQPGILGQPGRVLVPFAGHPRGAGPALGILRLLDGDLVAVHALVVEQLPRRRYYHQGPDVRARLGERARAYADRVDAELRAGLAEWSPHVDSSVSVSDDAAHEIVVQAGRHHARLILLGASERTLTERLIFGSPIERVLRSAPADVAIFREAAP